MSLASEAGHALTNMRLFLPKEWGKCKVQSAEFKVQILCALIFALCTGKMPFVNVEKWRKQQPESRWQHVVVREGSRGPLEVDVMICRVQAKIDRRVGDEERLVVIRFVNGDSIQHDYYLTNADETVDAKEFARVSKLGHTIEEDFRNAKSEAGLADYQVRNWHGWHHHVTMSLVTSWCLMQETLAQKKRTPK